MENKLNEFRKKKSKENFRRSIRDFGNIFVNFYSKWNFSLLTIDQNSYSNEETKSNENENDFDAKKVFWKIIFWFCLFCLFLYLQFGTIFIICSLFYLIYSNLGVGTGRRRNQLSAYSVFNPQFEKLQGTFSAENYEKQWRGN